MSMFSRTMELPQCADVSQILCWTTLTYRRVRHLCDIGDRRIGSDILALNSLRDCSSIESTNYLSFQPRHQINMDMSSSCPKPTYKRMSWPSRSPTRSVQYPIASGLPATVLASWRMVLGMKVAGCFVTSISECYILDFVHIFQDCKKQYVKL